METICINGNDFALGCLDRTAAIGSVRPCLEESIPIIAKADWKACDNSRYLPPIGLQAKHGACVGFQCTDAIMGQAVVQGQQVVKLSPWDLYRMICGGRDEGASISDALKVLHDEGVCALGLCQDFTLNGTRSFQQSADAARHKALESWDCPNRASIATALQEGFFTPLGVQVYSNFENLETIEGKPCIPKPAGKLRGGHCVCGCGLERIDGLWRVKIATKSWGLDFGDQGCVWYALDWLSDTYADAWALRSVTVYES